MRRAHERNLAAVGLWTTVLLAAAAPAAAQTPQITSVTPTPAGNQQMVTIRGANLLLTTDAPGSVTVEFGTAGAGSAMGSVVEQASSPTALYVRVPASIVGATYIPYTSVRVVKGNVLSNSFAFSTTSALVPPVLRAAYAQGGSSCSGVPNATALTQVYPGQWIALSADGIDIYGTSLNFTSTAGSFQGASQCDLTGSAFGIVSVVQVPTSVGTTGNLQINLSGYTFNGNTPFSNTITLALRTPPTPPVITSIQPNPAAGEQVVTIFGTNLKVPGGNDPVVEFNPSSDYQATGTVISAASSASAVYVQLPNAFYLQPGPNSVRLGNENGVANSTMDVSTTPTAPVIRNIYGFSTPPNPNNLCSGTLNPTPLTQIIPGQIIAVAANGISLANNSVIFSAAAGGATVASPCSISDSTIGVAAVVIAPANLSGCSVNIAIQTAVDQTQVPLFYGVDAPAAAAGGQNRSALVPSPPSAAVTRVLLSTSLSTTGLVSSLNPSTFGQAVTFTAAVASQLGCAIPTGTITFLDNGVPIGTAALNAAGSASLTTSTLAIGTHPITARYSGDARHTLSSSTTVSQVVRPLPLSLTGPCPSGYPMGALVQIPLTPAGGTGAYQYAYSGPTWLSLRANTAGPGVILEGTAPTYGTFPVTVTLSDPGVSVPAVYQCTVRISPPPLTLTSACPTNVSVGSLVRIALSPGGGTGSYQYSYSGPSWLSLKPGLTPGTMILEGTPTTTGSFPITVTLTDEPGVAPAVFRCTLQVDAPLTITGACPAPQAVPGSPYRIPVTVSGGSGRYEFFLTGPSWLSLSATTGTATNGSFQLVLSGTPTAAGSFPISVQVRDQVGTAYIYSNCSIEVVAPNLQITSGCPVSPAVVGTPYTFSLAATGGTQSYAWSIGTGSLPTGLSLSGNVISGTPQGPAGASNFSIVATSGLATGRIDCSLTVQPPPLTLTAACPAQAVVAGTGLSWSYTAGGGAPPYQFRLPSAAPNWLTLSSASAVATVTGTPPVSGSYPVVVEVTDTGGRSASASCDLVVTRPVCPPLELRAAGCPAPQVLAGVPYTLDVSAAGGRAPYTWSLAGPAWLGLQETSSTTARVRGTPPAAGPSNYTVSLRDSCESPAATLSCSLTATAVPQPQVAFSIGTVTDPLQQSRVEVRLGSPSPTPLEAEIALSFTANAFGVTDNARVQFLDPAATNNGRRLRITIPAGTVSLQVPIQTDTVAGLIRVDLASLGSGGQNLVAPPMPFAELTVPRLAPVITGMTLENSPSGGFDIVIAGYSTPRDMTNATVTFTARPGRSIDEPSTVTVAIADLFRNYYNSAASRTGGSTFSGLRLPVQIQGATDAVASVSVVLSNSAGASRAEVRTR